MSDLGNVVPIQPGLSESQLGQLQKAFENQPADVIRGQFVESSETVLEAATKRKPARKKPSKKKPKPKAKPRPKSKAKAKSQVV